MPRLTRRVLIVSALAAPIFARQVAASTGLRIAPMATGLDEPWSLAFLPDGRFLITEREGRLRLFAPDGGDLGRVAGLPEVAAVGQGGLLDIHAARDFARSRRLWLSYAVARGSGAATALATARLAADDRRLTDLREVYAGPATGGGRHFGSRIVEGRDGTIYLTTGDRGQGARAQDAGRPEGKVIAFAPDGSPRPPSLPGALPGLVSLGHRNIQGAALDGDGALWTIEHGARGGDELNRIRPGANYGWPVITYGRDYDGSKIGEGTARSGLEQPVHYWDPSIAPSGLLIHSGRMFADWRGHVLTGSLKFGLISRLDPGAGYAETRIETPETGRVRDIREAGDGAIWFLSVLEGTAFRMTPG